MFKLEQIASSAILLPVAPPDGILFPRFFTPVNTNEDDHQFGVGRHSQDRQACETTECPEAKLSEEGHKSAAKADRASARLPLKTIRRVPDYDVRS